MSEPLCIMMGLLDMAAGITIAILSGGSPIMFLGFLMFGKGVMSFF